MREYTFTLVIREGSDEFWEDINERDATGVDDVRGLIKEALTVYGFDIDGQDSLKLQKFILDTSQ